MWIEAQVTSLQRRLTPRGARLYVVLQTLEGRQVGIWTRDDHKDVRYLQLGDTVILHKNPLGRLRLLPPLISRAARVGLVAFRNKYWRLL